MKTNLLQFDKLFRDKTMTHGSPNYGPSVYPKNGRESPQPSWQSIDPCIEQVARQVQ